LCTRVSFLLGGQLVCFCQFIVFIKYNYFAFASFVLASYFAYIYLISD